MKKILMITAMLLILCMMPMALFSCNSGSNDPTEAPTDAPATDAPTDKPTDEPNKPTARPTESDDDPYADEVLEELTYYFDDEEGASAVKHIGRTLIDEGICCDQTASGIEFEAILEGDVSIEVKCLGLDDGSNGNDLTYFSVWVDGKRVEDTYDGEIRTDSYFYVDSKGETEVLEIASGLKKGKHTIRILKQNEPRYSIAKIETLTITGYLLDPPAEKEHYIEIFGDSITGGQGNAGVNGNKGSDKYTIDYSDGTKTYAVLAADKLNADFSVISESAIALDGSWFGDNRTIFDHFLSASLKRYGTEKEYDFESARVPDVVVINLGTNDYYINKDHNSSESVPAAVKEKAKQFIELVREKYGEDMPIVWVNGMLWYGEDHVAAIHSAIDELGGESAGLYKLTVPTNATGFNGHPNGACHVTAGQLLEQFIKDKGLLD